MALHVRVVLLCATALVALVAVSSATPWLPNTRTLRGDETSKQLLERQAVLLHELAQTQAALKALKESCTTNPDAPHCSLSEAGKAAQDADEADDDEEGYDEGEEEAGDDKERYDEGEEENASRDTNTNAEQPKLAGADQSDTSNVASKAEDEPAAETPKRNLTMPDIMKENIFLLARERLAATKAQTPPWYEEHEDEDALGLLNLYYATPVYRTNINLVKGRGTSARINAPLVEKIMAMYLGLVQRGQSASNMLHAQGLATYNEINNKFFDEQDIEGDNFLEGTPEMTELKEFWREALQHFWPNVPGNVNPKLLEQYGSEFFYWAAVNHWGIDHQPHVHFESVLSGVYYLKTPPMSGSFELHDSRGSPKYPFEHHHSIKPIEGDLVIFPGWQPHGVLPTYGAEPRVAIAFNIQAPAEAWLDTTDVFETKVVRKG